MFQAGCHSTEIGKLFTPLPYLPPTNTPLLQGHFLPFTLTKISESHEIDLFHLQESKVEISHDPYGLPDKTRFRSGQEFRSPPFCQWPGPHMAPEIVQGTKAVEVLPAADVHRAAHTEAVAGCHAAPAPAQVHHTPGCLSIHCNHLLSSRSHVVLGYVAPVTLPNLITAFPCELTLL